MNTNGARADLERKEEAARPELPKNPFRTAVRVASWEGEQEMLCIWKSLLCLGRDLLFCGSKHGLSPACGCGTGA